jgi:hypothetical protein
MPRLVSLANANPGAARFPSTPCKAAVIDPFPLRDSESLNVSAISVRVVLAQVVVIVVPVVTGLPAGSVYSPETARDIA